MKISRERIEELRTMLRGSVFAKDLFTALDEREELLVRLLTVINRNVLTGFQCAPECSEPVDKAKALLRGGCFEIK